MSQPAKNNAGKAESDFGEGTRLESVEEIRRALANVQRTPTLQERAIDDTLAYRPAHRPPMALLCILDDGGDDGELVRIRSDKIVIGRVDVDICIPHDTSISARHAEISRVVVSGGFRWYLTDLQSTNGTFVRISSSVLKHDQEIMIGGRRYRFDAALQGATVSTASPGQSGTRGWQSVAPTDLIPSLVDVTPQTGQRLFLKDGENWIGRDANLCSVVLPNDPLVSPRHARLFKDAKGRWQIENAGAKNGTWVRINRIPLVGAGYFQLGEQKFQIRV